jgi:hypothetical protein
MGAMAGCWLVVGNGRIARANCHCLIAPFTSGGACGSEYNDILLALATARKGGGSLYPALATADWSQTGVGGHSMSYTHYITIHSLLLYTHFYDYDTLTIRIISLGMSVPGAAVATGHNITTMYVS